VPDYGEFDGSIGVALEEARQAAGLEGLAVVDCSGDRSEPLVSFIAGVGGRTTIHDGCGLLGAHPEGPAHMVASDRRPVMVCPWVLRPSRSGGLILWRSPKAATWTDADYNLASALAVLVRAFILSGISQVGIDRLTGLPNRRWFIDEADRHIDRLDLDNRVGTLSVIDIDDLRQVNATYGREGADAVLVRLAGQLRGMIRPSDLVARIGEDQFAVWQNGMDHLTAAERADALCTMRPFQDLPNDATARFSVGIVCRDIGSGEDIRVLLRRAHLAVSEVKSQGGGGWRVSHRMPTERGSNPST
jgi:diguanylate cyclase (GGDEF)-like protein